jgi:hypothetical protein
MSNSITTLVALTQFIVLIIICCILSYRVMHGLAVTSRKYLILRILLFPGVIVHELAHAVACVITNTKIERISFWDEAGGSVTHHKPRFSFVTQPLISLAPLPVGIGLLFLLSTLLSPIGWISLPILLIMVSLAATLAPSQTDFIHAIEGLIFLFGVAIAIIFALPALATPIQTTITPLNQHLLLIVAILASMWIMLLFSHQIMKLPK